MQAATKQMFLTTFYPLANFKSYYLILDKQILYILTVMLKISTALKPPTERLQIRSFEEKVF